MHEHVVLPLSATAFSGHGVHGPVPVPVLIEFSTHCEHCIAPLTSSFPSEHVVGADGEAGGEAGGEGGGEGDGPPQATGVV